MFIYKLFQTQHKKRSLTFDPLHIFIYYCSWNCTMNYLT